MTKDSVDNGRQDIIIKVGKAYYVYDKPTEQASWMSEDGLWLGSTTIRPDQIEKFNQRRGKHAES